MAYRKTEKVLAQLEARRAGIMAAAIDVIAKSGLEGLTVDAVAERGEIAVGLIYRYFPDKTELLAAVVQFMLERDLKAIQTAGSNCNSPAEAFIAGISVFADRITASPRLMADISRQPAYREGMKARLAALIGATKPSEPATVLASVVYGAVLEGAGHLPRFERALTSAVLRAVGLESEKVS